MMSNINVTKSTLPIYASVRPLLDPGMEAGPFPMGQLKAYSKNKIAVLSDTWCSKVINNTTSTKLN